MILSTKEASEIIGCTQRYLSQRIAKGFLKARRAGKIYLLSKLEVERFKKTYSPRNSNHASNK